MTTIYKFIKKPKLSIKILQILQLHEFDLHDQISILNFSMLGMLLNFGGKVCHSLLPMNLAVTILYVAVLTAGDSVSTPLRMLYDTFLSIKISVIKSGFSCDFILKISIISNCSFLSWVVTGFFVMSYTKVETLSLYSSLRAFSCIFFIL